MFWSASDSFGAIPVGSGLSGVVVKLFGAFSSISALRVPIHEFNVSIHWF